MSKVTNQHEPIENVGVKRKHPPIRVFVGGGQKYWGPTATRDEEITRILPELLYRFAPEVEIVTGGMEGIADIFAKGWKGSCLDVVSSEYVKDYLERRTGRTFSVIGHSQEKRRLAVTGMEGIECAVFIQGGKYSTHEIKLFQERGIPIVTLYGGGGASGGYQPYEGWIYTPDESVLNSIVASTDPNEDAFKMANEMTGAILHNISTARKEISFEEEEAKRTKMDLTSSMSGDAHLVGEEDEGGDASLLASAMDIDEEGKQEEEEGEGSEEPWGLMCVPPGMSAQQVDAFNADFKALTPEERLETMHAFAQKARDAGIQVVNIGDTHAMDEMVKKVSADLKTRATLKAAQEDQMAHIQRVTQVGSVEGCGPIRVIFAFDIESRGDSLEKNGILSIGYCVGQENGSCVIEKGRIDLAPLQYIAQKDIVILDEIFAGLRAKVINEMGCGGINYVSPESELPKMTRTQVLEQRCLDEFWHNEEKFPGNKERLELMTSQPVDAMEGIKLFRSILDRFDDGVYFKAHIVSDNVVFDAGWVNHYLYKAGCYDLSHNAKGRYRRIFDMVDFRRGVCHMDHADKWLNEKGIIKRFGLTVDPDMHNHMPEDDSEYIFRFYTQLVNKVSQYPIGYPDPEDPLPESGYSPLREEKEESAHDPDADFVSTTKGRIGVQNNVTSINHF